MSRLHRLYSRYACLSPEAIDFVLEHVRDANEVLFESEQLGARSMILVARSVLETERLLQRDPRFCAELGGAPVGDWTLACIAEGMCQTASQLDQRGAEQARADLRSVLMRIVDSPARSPLLSYGAVLSDLMYEHPRAGLREKLALQHRAIAEDLLTHSQSNVLAYLCELGETFLQLDHEDLALLTFMQLTRFAPTDIALHNQLAFTLSSRFPELARSAAERALLLMPRDDTHALRPQLQRLMEELTRKTTENLLSAVARGLLIELRSTPGMRGRASLRTLCTEIAPEIEHLPQKQLEPLPSARELAQLRCDLNTLYRAES